MHSQFTGFMFRDLYPNFYGETTAEQSAVESGKMADLAVDDEYASYVPAVAQKPAIGMWLGLIIVMIAGYVISEKL